MTYLVYFLAGVGIGSIMWAVIERFDLEDLIHNLFQKKYRHKNFEKYMERSAFAEQKYPIPPQEHDREISELTYRDIDNKLCTARIIIDRSLGEDLTEQDGVKYFEQHPNPGENEEFVFTGEAIELMKNQGKEVDEFVRDILRQRGRIV